MRTHPAPRTSRRRLLPAAALAAIAVAAAPATSDAASRARVESSLRSQLRALPGSSSAIVRDQATGRILAQRGARVERIPASVTKLFTTSSLLLLDGPDGRLTTDVLATGPVDESGVLRGDLIVRAGGNPMLRPDQIAQLARMVKRAGIERISGSVRADLGGWTRRQGTPTTGGRYSSEIGGRIGALVTMRGFSSGGSDPAAQVLSRLVSALRSGGMKGTLRIASPRETPEAAEQIGRVNSPKVSAMIAATNLPSDNFYAEMLLRGIGARHGDGGTTPYGILRERRVLDEELDIDPELVDGSGLSRGNRVSPTTVVNLLDGMAEREEEGPALKSSLPVAGRSGTLAGRMRGSAAQDRCRGKTGTLSNVSALAGYCTTRGGRTVTFAILMNKVSVSSARRRQDRILATAANWTDALPARRNGTGADVVRASRAELRPDLTGVQIAVPGSVPGTGD